MRPDALFLGLDIGTSGVRTAVVDGHGGTVAAHAVPMHARALGEGVDAEVWWNAARECLGAQVAALPDPGALVALAIDGTSGTMVLTDPAGDPAGPGLMYDSRGFEAESARIAPHAPPGSIARGAGSALARFLRLVAISDARARHLAHQADLVAARLTGAPGRSDESNALKTGFDAEARRWPGWIEATGAPLGMLPRVVPVGAPFGTIAPGAAAALGLPPGLRLVAGATDSVAAFLAAGTRAPGAAVTSLGSTLALKIVSPVRVEDPARGVYSHRIGDAWLAGGASNVGGRALLRHFTPERIAALSERIDPARDSGLAYRPLDRKTHV